MDALKKDLTSHLPKDLIRLLALELDKKSLINLCTSSKRFNEILCNDSSFWREKLEKDFPRYMSIIPKNVDYRRYYMAFKK